MRKQDILRRTAVITAAVILLLAASAVSAQEISYDGTFTLSPVGDLSMVQKLTLPMDKYQSLRNSVSNLYLFTRGLASNRAGVEVAERKAEWDDSTRTVMFTIKMLGAARNMGNHWELDIGPGAVFSNLDEAKKMVYFNESVANEMGAVRGNSRLQLPALATQANYDASRKVVSYVMPKTSSGSMKSKLLMPAAILLVLGLVIFGASFMVGRRASPRPPGPSV
jgi:hypothetical protein